MKSTRAAGPEPVNCLAVRALFEFDDAALRADAARLNDAERHMQQCEHCAIDFSLDLTMARVLAAPPDMPPAPMAVPLSAGGSRRIFAFARIAAAAAIAILFFGIIGNLGGEPREVQPRAPLAAGSQELFFTRRRVLPGGVEEISDFAKITMKSRSTIIQNKAKI